MNNPEEAVPLVRNRTSRTRWRRRLKNCCDVTLWIRLLSFTLVGLISLAMVLYLFVYLKNKLEDHSSDSFPSDILPFEFATREDSNFEKAWEEGEQLVIQRQDLEKLLYVKGLTPERGSPSFVLQSYFRKRVEYMKLEECAIIAEHVRRTLGKCIAKYVLPDYCEADWPRVCAENRRHRTFNGSCNNLRHPHWGMAKTPYARMINPQYADGVSSPRGSLDGSGLPNPRVLSNKLYSHRYLPDSNCTLITMIFGLFVDHDMVSTAIQTGQNYSAISCCDQRVVENPSLRHPECFPVEIPKWDPFYTSLGITCLDLMRSSPVVGKCSGQREQLNLASSFLDGSGIYGSSEDENRSLRNFTRGLLLVSTIKNLKFLPQDEERDPHCGTYKEQLKCFKAGDLRVNMQETLTMMHTVWMREHNRIAMLLSEGHPDWDDETLFQEARRITIGELQHITYNEFLPLVLGSDAMRRYRLEMKKSKSYEGYNAHVEPGVYNVFPTAAFRFGHSLIQGVLAMPSGMNNKSYQLPLRETFFNMGVIYRMGLDPLILGSATQRSRSSDSCINSELRNHLFQESKGSYGFDLSAIGIQRGRDHGLPGYTKWREACKLSLVSKWDDLDPIMADHHIQHLKDVYRYAEDIDLIPGALAENHVTGSLVGPTFTCLLGRQFHLTKTTDRFWFENRRHEGSFSEDQLNEIYKSNMARIVCDNSDDIQVIQRWLFKIVSEENPVVKCSDLPQVNLSIWNHQEIK